MLTPATHAEAVAAPTTPQRQKIEDLFKQFHLLSSLSHQIAFLRPPKASRLSPLARYLLPYTFCGLAIIPLHKIRDRTIPAEGIP